MYKRLWFLLGLGSQLQVIASLSLSEAAVLIVAPIILLSEFPWMRKTRVHVFFYVSLLLVCGCCLACVANHTAFQYALRGLATTILLLLTVVVVHRLFRMDLNGFKWYFVGVAISMTLCTFVFQRFGELEAYGGGGEGLAAVRDIMNSPIFWIQRLNAFLTLPGKGWYLSVPLWVSVAGTMFMAAFSLLKSSSGRSAALSAMAACVIMLIGQRRRATMSRVAKNLWLWVGVGAVIVFLFNKIYGYAAESGIMGEESRRKYEVQTSRGKDVISLIMGGRSDSFVGLLACRDKPLVGWGPWAIDEGGYRAEFMEKYGTDEDVKNLMWYESLRLSRNARPGLIPCHAYIVEFWTWYGALGLLYWLYAIFTFVRYMRKDIATVPQWFCWLGAGMPGMFWGIFFSPLTDRIGVVLFIVACLMARAIRKGWYVLPAQMIHEIERVEH